MRLRFFVAPLLLSLGCSSASFDVAKGNGDDGSVGADADSSIGGDGTTTDATDFDTTLPGDATAEVIVDDTGIGSDVACAALAKSQCAKLESCIPFYVKVVYGDTTTCKEREFAFCMSSIDAPGVTWRHGQVVACAVAIDAESCGDAELGITPTACVPTPGTLVEGSTCFNGAQCASTSCDFKPGASCGACAAGTEGSLCNTQCAPNLLCTPDGHCHAPMLKVDDSCDNVSKICAPSMSCVSGKCRLKGTSDGTPCDTTLAIAPDCYAAAGELCPTLAAPTCVTVDLAADGAHCDGAGTATECRGTDRCIGNVCTKASADGASCSATQPCLPLARCIGGKCAIVDATICAP